MLSSFTRDEKKILVFLTVLLGTGSCLNIFWGSRARQPIIQVSPNEKWKKHASTTSTAILTETRTTASRSIASLSVTGKIDLNLATAESLQSLPGIGPKTADTILSYRTQNGPFHTISDLENVKGIGPAKLKQISSFVEISTTSLGSKPSALIAVSLASKTAISSSTISHQSGPSSNSERVTNTVNINTADEEQLSTLDYVGPVLARRIIEFRNQHGPFPSVDSIDRVKGIGPRILAANRHRITVQ